MLVYAFMPAHANDRFIQLAAVGLDVFPNEPQVNPRLLEFPQVVLLPHMGTENQDSQRKMEVRALTNLRDYILNGMGRDLVSEFKNTPKL
jgi:lactate dehydrogenase-like 2-hydroxyacid dehydrogenase